jgi:polysaccharide biosynthesis/export protein
MRPHRFLTPVSPSVAMFILFFMAVDLTPKHAWSFPSSPAPASAAPPVAAAEPAPVLAAGRRTIVAQSTATTTVQNSTPAAPSATDRPEDEYRIGPEDILQISVWKNEAISRTVAVRPDGKVSLPLVNDVTATGLTPMEFRDVLVNKLTEYVSNPEVSVMVLEAHSFKVSVLGEVSKPGRYEFKSRATVLDAIALAGGLNQFASRRAIVVLRPEGNGNKRLPFNYNKAVSAGGEQENFYLRPGDVVVVP